MTELHPDAPVTLPADTQPAALVQLRRKFEAGYVPRGAAEDDGDDESAPCRVCRA